MTEPSETSAAAGGVDILPDYLTPEFLCYNMHLLSEKIGGSLLGHSENASFDNVNSLLADMSKLLSNNHILNNTSGDNASLSASHSGNESYSYCKTDWDNLVCWPKTRVGQMATAPCFGELNGIFYDTSQNATRYCLEGGNWTKSDYSGCSVLNGTSGPNEVGNLAIQTGVYFFGYCVSLCALVIAILIFLVFKELRCLRNTIHTHLMITYILADTLWIITSSTTSTGSSGGSGMGGGNFGGGGNIFDNQTIEASFMAAMTASGGGGTVQSNQVPCITFILLHYFHLTNFFWMFVEGLYLYVLVVKTFVSENIKLRVYACIGWGVPLVVVIAWSIAKWITQTESPELQTSDPEFSATSCLWLPVNEYDWIYKTPVILVLAANLIFLLQIMWVLITKLRSAMNPETQQSIKAAKAMVVLMPLLGITYVLILSGSRAQIYEYLRALLISTQGFLVSLLYCFLNGEVRQAIRHRWNRLRLMGPVCCDFERRRHQIQHMTKDWSPRSRTESIRYPCATQRDFRKGGPTLGGQTAPLTSVNGGVGGTGSCGSGYGHNFINGASTTPGRNGNAGPSPPPSAHQLHHCSQQVFPTDSAGAGGDGRGGMISIIPPASIHNQHNEKQNGCRTIFNPEELNLINTNQEDHNADAVSVDKF